MPKSDDAILFGEAMSKHTPWTDEEAEKWATAHQVSVMDDLGSHNSLTHVGLAFLAGLQKAAEMIEACPTVYGETTIAQYGREVPTGNWTETRVDTYDTHSAKLVGVRPIEGSEK